MTTVTPPGNRSWQFYYVANFTDYRFLQVFYPTRGILALYDREAKKVHELPGADDAKFAQTGAVWSPDGNIWCIRTLRNWPRDGAKLTWRRA